jgi:hypothetical protein
MPKDKSFLQQLRYDVATKPSEVNPFQKQLWFDDLPTEIASPLHTVIFSGPPLVTQMMNDPDAVLTPIGLVQDVQLSSQRQLVPLPELGNRYFRHVGGRWNHSATLSRVLSLSGNIIGMMYRWYLGQPDAVFHLNPTAGQLPDPRRPTGSKSLHAMSPDSDLLDYPFGIYVAKMDEEGETISAQYWERCMIASYSDTISGGNAIIMETLQLVITRIIPVENKLPVLDGTPYILSQSAANGAFSDPIDGAAPTLVNPATPNDLQGGFSGNAPVQGPGFDGTPIGGNAQVPEFGGTAGGN